MHLSDEQIAILIDGKGNKEERESCFNHLFECRECFEVYAESLKSLENFQNEKFQKRFFMVIVRKKLFFPILTAALLLLSIPFIWEPIKKSSLPDHSIELIEIQVAKGEQQLLTLDDGTQVKLDAGSNFKYPAKFTGKNREVLLAGEGYFEVPSSNNNPFYVNTDYAEIKVLGTKFNIRAWEETNKVKVAVANGKVSLRPLNSNPQTAVLINQGQLSILSKDGLPSKPIEVNINEHLKWMDRNMSFYNTPLQEILLQLERWYDISFMPDNQISLSDQLTIHFLDMTIDDALELISNLTVFEFNKIGRTVFLSKK